jgi:hypothetical protein
VARWSAGRAPQRAGQLRQSAPRRSPAPERRNPPAHWAPSGAARRAHGRDPRRHTPGRSVSVPVVDLEMPGMAARRPPATTATVKGDTTARTSCAVTRRQESPYPRSAICPAGRAGSAAARLGIGGLASSAGAGRHSIRTHVRRPTGPPLLYFAAVFAVRSVRIMLLTSGAKEIRTPDLLHAIWRQHVHPRPSPQVTVLLRPCAATSGRVRCGTPVLYRSNSAETSAVSRDEGPASDNPASHAKGACCLAHRPSDRAGLTS